MCMLHAQPAPCHMSQLLPSSTPPLRPLPLSDLVRELRGTKLEAEAQPPAKFVEVVVSASGPASAPSSPGTRTRQSRKRGFTTGAALV